MRACGLGRGLAAGDAVTPGRAVLALGFEVAAAACSPSVIGTNHPTVA